jgi:hypothetical protein
LPRSPAGRASSPSPRFSTTWMTSSCATA